MTLMGWVHRSRDHGGVLFIDLRDHYGLTQVVADPDSPAFKIAEKLHAEWVVRIDGKVRKRPEGTENPDLPTGQVSLHTQRRGLGPDYPGCWDRSKNEAPDRLCRWIASLLTESRQDAPMQSATPR